MNTRGVHQNQLVLVLVHNTADRVAGRLRTVRGDSHLLANHSVRQSGLTRIRAAHQRRETRTEILRVGRQRGAQVQSAQIERGVLLVHCVSPCQTPAGCVGCQAHLPCAFGAGRLAQSVYGMMRRLCSMSSGCRAYRWQVQPLRYLPEDPDAGAGPPPPAAPYPR